MASHNLPNHSLTEQVADAQHLNPAMADDAWVEVIQRMDVIYADLVNSQVALEEKNAELEQTHQFIESVLSSMHDVLVVTNIDGKIKHTNLALSALTLLTLHKRLFVQTVNSIKAVWYTI